MENCLSDMAPSKTLNNSKGLLLLVSGGFRGVPGGGGGVCTPHALVIYPNSNQLILRNSVGYH